MPTRMSSNELCPDTVTCGKVMRIFFDCLTRTCRVGVERQHTSIIQVEYSRVRSLSEYINGAKLNFHFLLLGYTTSIIANS
jgi:hypothetical protein